MSDLLINYRKLTLDDTIEFFSFNQKNNIIHNNNSNNNNNNNNNFRY
jgi:hypothetical protein